jgi:hypothetical protein
MPCIRPDDLKLYFHKAPGLNVDLFVSARLNSAVAFDPPVNLGPVNTPGVEASGCVSTSGQVLYYFSDNGTTGLFRATLDITDTFSSPVELVQLAPSVGALNTEPTPTEDDQTLYFSSFSADGVGAGEIWVSRRPSPGEDFGAPVLVTELNTPQSDRVDWISPDGCQVYITSDRAGGAGGTDLWLASRPPL